MWMREMNWNGTAVEKNLLLEAHPTSKIIFFSAFYGPNQFLVS